MKEAYKACTQTRNRACMKQNWPHYPTGYVFEWETDMLKASLQQMVIGK